MTPPRPDARAGFTLVEVAMVLAIVSILVRIALPNVQEAMTRARAAAALGDVEVVRTAAAAYYARSNQWPGGAPAGVVPEGLDEDLPEGFTFDRGTYQLHWERWTLLEDPRGGGSSPSTLLGVSIATDDELLGNAVAALLGERGWYTLGHNVTFLISGM